MENENLTGGKRQSAGRTHKLTLDNHKLLSLTGVKSVPTFTEKGISVELDAERLEISGRELEVKNLNVEDGTLVVGGYVTALRYGAESGGLLKKLLK